MDTARPWRSREPKPVFGDFAVEALLAEVEEVPVAAGVEDQDPLDDAGAPLAFAHDADEEEHAVVVRGGAAWTELEDVTAFEPLPTCVEEAEPEVAVQPPGAREETERERKLILTHRAIDELAFALSFIRRLIDEQAPSVADEDLTVGGRVVPTHLAGLLEDDAAPRALGAGKDWPGLSSSASIVVVWS